jgi:hypothetical protein
MQSLARPGEASANSIKANRVFGMETSFSYLFLF